MLEMLEILGQEKTEKCKRLVFFSPPRLERKNISFLYFLKLRVNVCRGVYNVTVIHSDNKA